MSLYQALIDFRDNDNNPYWVSQEDSENIVSIKTVVKSNRGKSLVELSFDYEEYAKLFIDSKRDNMNDNLIGIAFGNYYHGDSVFIDTYYYGDEEFKEGYIIGEFSDENLDKLREILKIAYPKVSKLENQEQKSECAQWMLLNFKRESEEIASDYAVEFDNALVEGLKEYLLHRLCDPLKFLMVIEQTCGKRYYTTVDNLIKLYEMSKLNKDAEISEVLSKIIADNDLLIDEDLYEDYYSYYDSKNFDSLSFNKEVERQLNKIEEKIQEQLEEGDLKKNKEIYDFLMSKNFKFDEWTSFPKEKNFNKSDGKFKIRNIEDGKVHIIATHSNGTRGGHLDLEGLKKFLYHPELF